MENAKITVYNKKINEEPIEAIYMGTLREEDESTVIKYDESNLTGMEGVYSKLILKKDSLKIIRTGNIESTIYFKEGIKKEFEYTLEFGSLNLLVDTHKFYNVRDKHEIKIIIIYDIVVPGNELDRNEMKIRIEKI